MTEDKIIDQSPLAEDISKSIKYNFLDFFLVKPLDPIKVKKEFSVPVDTTIRKDEDGIEEVHSSESIVHSEEAGYYCTRGIA